MTFEICATNLASCHAARLAGAHRIELCSGLDAGGLTPSAGLIKSAIEKTGLPVNVLIRVREGDFYFSKEEIEVMVADIKICRKMGANGVVIGALKTNGKLDISALKKMVAAAGTLEVVCHRAIDFTKNPFEALEQLIKIGVRRVLTSGQTETAFDGRFHLKKMMEHAAGRIEIMPGSGINASNIAEIRRVTGATQFHFTGKERAANEKSGKKIDNLAASFWVSSEKLIREIIEKVEHSS